MEMMINSKSFSDARIGLPKEISNKVEKTLLQLFDNEHSKGLHQEKIYDDVYSARVDDTYRIIYSKYSGKVVLMYVGIHDEAYIWAKKHSFRINEYIGSAQIIENVTPRFVKDPKNKKRLSRLSVLTDDDMRLFEIPDEWWESIRTQVFIKENLIPYKQVLSEATMYVLEEVLNGDDDLDDLRDFYKDVTTPKEAPRLKKKIESVPMFSRYTDEELLKVGIPVEYLDMVRSLKDEEDLVRFEKKLPDIIVQSLYALKAGISVEEIYRTTFADSEPVEANDIDAALQNPITLAELAPIPDEEALSAMMEFPMEQWRAFLHPAQRRLVERDYAGPARIIGGAGTGKTVVIVHRARYLARKCSANRKVLVTTYNRTLAADIHSRLCMICSQEELEKIEVTTVDQLTRRIAKVMDLSLIYEGNKTREGLGNLTYIWFKSMGGMHIPGITPDFLLEEWQDVIQAQNVKTLEEYCTVRRESRGKRLDRKTRTIIWPVLERYKNECMYDRKMDADYAQNYLAEYLTGKGISTQYEHILVDECQDLRAPAFRLLRAVAGKQHENDLYFSGDSRQRIYKGKASLSQCGVIINNRSTELKINYRTTAEIFETAAKVQKEYQYDDLDGKAISDAECVCIAHGESPRVVGTGSVNDEIKTIADDIIKNLKTGIPDVEICVVARTKSLVNRLAKELIRMSINTLILDNKTKDDPSVPGVRVATMHRIKGMEFNCMYIAFASSEFLPLRAEVRHAENDEKQEVMKQEANLLSVAMTRAKRKVLITYSGNPSPFLKTIIHG